MTSRILCGDARAMLATLSEKSVHCVVTSPPYWNLRRYDTVPVEWPALSYSPMPGLPPIVDVPAMTCELGQESTPEAYIGHLVLVFREVKRVMADDATCWINVGDSYAGASVTCDKRPGSGRADGVVDDRGQRNRNGIGMVNGLKAKNLIGVPWRLAFALQADGWWLRSDIIWCLSGGVWLYARTQKGDMPVMVKDLVRLRPETVKLWNGTKWTQVLGWSQSTEIDRPFEIELRSGERIGCTRGHQWPTKRGLLRADELVIGDVIETTQLPEPEAPKNPSALGLEVAWLCGLYLAEGSMSGETVQISCHENESAGWLERIEHITNAFHGSIRAHIYGNKASLCLNGPVIASVMRAYVHGDNCYNKGVKVRAWMRSNEWLMAFLQGYLDGDAHYDAPNDRWRLGFCRNDRLADDLRTITARLGLSLRLNATTATGFGREWPAYRGDIRLVQTKHHNARIDGGIVAIRGSRARKFWDIGVEDEPHTFALASGVLTHNSKKNPMPSSVEDRCSVSHEYIFMLAKAEQYYFDRHAIAEASLYPGDTRHLRTDNTIELARPDGGSRARTASPTGETRNKRSVWTINAGNFSEAHFACVDESTDCLTERGWVQHQNLDIGTKAAQFDLATGRLSWAPVIDIARYEVVDQEMVYAKTISLDMLLTPNHRCIIHRRDPKTRKYKDAVVVRADKLVPSHAVPSTADWNFVGDASLPCEWAELLGWYIAEGHACKQTVAVEISQSETANPERVQRIEQLLRQVGAEWTKAIYAREWRGRPAIGVYFRVSGYAAARLRELAPGKLIPQGALMWGNEQIRALLEGLIEGDGHTRLDGRVTFIQKSEACASMVQALAFRLGLSATLTRKADGMSRVYITKHKHRSFRGTSGVGIPTSRVLYTGVVWCPHLPHGTWVARRNGRIFITGNTFPAEIPTIAIKAGTSERGHCPACNKRWVRVVDRTPMVINKTVRNIERGTRTGTSGTMVSPASSITTGWQAQCACGLSPVPDVVLDCFGGAGTTALAAERLQRDSIMIELSEVYASMSRKRIVGDAPLFTELVA